MKSSRSWEGFSLEEKLAYDYLKAKDQKDCASFRELKRRDNFPVKGLLEYQIINFCQLDESKQEEYLEHGIGAEKWIQKSYFDLLSKKASREKFKDLKSISLFHLGKIEANKKRKEKYLLEAFSLSSNEDFKKDIQEVLLEIAPRFIKAPGLDEIRSVAEDYEWNREFEKAETIYRGMLETTDDRAELWEKIAKLNKKWKGKEAYADILKEAISFEQKNNKDLNSLSSNLNLLARAYWTVNEYNKAFHELNKAIRLKSKDEFKARAHLTKSLIYKELKKKIESKEQLFLASKLAEDDETIIKVFWYKGWNSFLEENYRDAAASFEKALAAGPEGLTLEKLLFWKAICFEKIGRKDQSQESYSELQEIDPFGFYGNLSLIYSGKSLKAYDIKTPPVLEDNIYNWLSILKESNFLKEYSESIDSEDDLNGILSLYLNSENFKKLLGLFYKNDYETRMSILKSYPQFGFPNAYISKYSKLAKKGKVNTFFPMSITRQESGFNKDARSGADAFGLMQITIETAKKYKSISGDIRSHLYDPDNNIEIGVKILGSLLKKYSSRNQFAAIAAYNAGETPVNHWLKSRGTSNQSFSKLERDLIWIEEIPYKETRKYVKYVTRNLIMYKRLYSEELSIKTILDLTY